MDLQAKLVLLEEENRNLKLENQSRSDYLSMVVHQLRTPLAATKWIFKMMMDGDLGNISEDQRNIIKRGFENNESMIRMLAEVSAANHTSEWKLKFNIKPTDIVDCIDSVLGEFAGEAKAKNIILHFQRPEALPLVLADKEKICLVLQNLVENAIKYNHVSGSVTLNAEVFNERAVVSITDTGMGIPLEDQKNIFTKFYRGSNTKQEKGTGLGLFVGKQIIEGHRGTLWFESVPNIGTTFFFSLPIVQ
jgi:signal transduction histidine kinase